MKRIVMLGPGAAVLPGLEYGSGSFAEHYAKLLKNISGISKLETPISGDRVHITHGGVVKDFEPPPFKRQLIAHARKSILMSLTAAKIALEKSGLPLNNEGAIDTSALRISPFHIISAGGSGFGDGEALANFHKLFEHNEWRKIGVRAVPAVMPNGPTTTVAMFCGARGRSETISTACASSSDALGSLYHDIKNGKAEIGIAIGTDTLQNPFYTVLFGLATALSKSGRSLPFGKERDGFVLSEGAACAILISLELAKKAKLEEKILCEIIGYGATTDCRDMTAPDFEGSREAISEALRESKESGIGAEDVSIVIAHGTSTLAGDLNEAQIIPDAYLGKPWVYSPKSQIGHTMGAAGLIGALVGAHAVKSNSLPSLGDYPIDEVCAKNGANFLIGSSLNQQHALRVAACHALGFGGQNSVLILKKYEG